MRLFHKDSKKRYGTLALLRTECNGIESEQGSGSEGDAVLYNAWLLSLDWRGRGEGGVGRGSGVPEGHNGS